MNKDEQPHRGELVPVGDIPIDLPGVGRKLTARRTTSPGFIRRSLIIWDKGYIVPSRGHYNWRHESCWYAVKKGAQPN